MKQRKKIGQKYRSNDRTTEVRPPKKGKLMQDQYYPGTYKDEANAFLKERIGEEVYNHVMSQTNGREHSYVAARVFLKDRDWEKFVWIEQQGSLEGFPEY